MYIRICTYKQPPKQYFCNLMHMYICYQCLEAFIKYADIDSVWLCMALYGSVWLCMAIAYWRVLAKQSASQGGAPSPIASCLLPTIICSPGIASSPGSPPHMCVWQPLNPLKNTLRTKINVRLRERESLGTRLALVDSKFSRGCPRLSPLVPTLIPSFLF
jgi:hypothetical protein